MTDIRSNYLMLSDGHRIPQEGFGVYKLTNPKQLKNAIQTAYESGYRLFDTAQMYGNEAELGSALQKLSVPRDDYFITTKVSEANQGYQRAIDSVKQSLKRLQLDYVDLLLVHWPIHSHFFETWRAFEEMKKEGLTKSIGVSNFGMAHLQLLATQADEMPVLDQLETHPRLTQKAMIKYNQTHHIVTQAWAPLGRTTVFDIPELKKLAAQHHKSVAQIILRWHLQNDISFIPKSAHPARIKENADIYDFSLNADEMATIDGLNHNHRISQEPEMVYEFDKQYPHHFKN